MMNTNFAPLAGVGAQDHLRSVALPDLLESGILCGRAN